MKKIISIAAVILIISGSASAMETPDIAIDGGTRVGTVSGGTLTETERRTPVKMIVLKPSENADSVKSSDIVWIDEKYAEKDGNFDFSFQLRPEDEGGLYRIVFQNKAAGRVMLSAMYLSNGKKAELLTELDAAKETEIGTWLADNAENFGLTSLFTEWESLSSDSKAAACKALSEVSLQPKEDLSDLTEKIQLLSDAFKQAIVLGIANDITDTDELDWHIKNNADVIPIPKSIVDKMDALGEAEKRAALERLLDISFKEPLEIVSEYSYSVLANVIVNAKHWSEISVLCEEILDMIPVAHDKFEKVASSDIQDVYAALLGKTYSSMKEIGKAIDQAVEKALNKKESHNSGNSGGGGGKSTGSRGEMGVTFAPAAEVEMTKEEKEAELEKSIIFYDIDDVPWAKEAIEELARRKVVNGYGEKRFAPHDLVTRGQFTKMVVGALGLTGNLEREAYFMDVRKDNIFAQWIQTAYGLGIVNGVSEMIFGVDTPITRQDAAVIINRALEYIGETKDGVELGFADGDEIADYAKPAVAALAANGIVSGRENNRFCPIEFITRAEAAKIIYFSAENVLTKEIK